MTGRRGKLEIIYDILRHAKEPMNRTQLMMKTMLTWKSFISYAGSLVERGLLKKVEPTTRSLQVPYLYVTTSKGRALCDLFDRIYDILGWSERGYTK